jgi:release factor glutamine methyltransferase
MDKKGDLYHRDWLLRHKYAGQIPAPEDLAADWVRLDAGEPLDYVIGWSDFLGCRIDLFSRPLIPRAETEYWTKWAIEAINGMKEDSIRVLDLCAGSGCIGVAVLRHTKAQVDFIEREKKHLEQIEKNIFLNNIDPLRAGLTQSDLFEALHQAGKKYHFILANPPYIPTARVLPVSVIRWEPSEALRAGGDGLAVIRRLITESWDFFVPGGSLWLECDMDNIPQAAQLAAQEGFQEVVIHPDQYGRPRWITAKVIDQ